MERISHYSGKPYQPGLTDTSFQQKTASWVQRVIRKVAGTGLKGRLRLRGVEHLPAHGPYIVAANHQSYFDPVALSAAIWKERKIKPNFLTKVSVAAKWKKFLGEKILHVFGMLPVDRHDKSLVLKTAEEHLYHGGVIGIFPEGTRNKPSLNPDWRTSMLKGKTGVARLQLATKVPVIPAGIAAPPGHSHIQTLLNLIRWWQPVTITFGPAVDFPSAPSGEPTKEELEAVTRAVMKDIGKLTGLQYPH
jgi:1-acyl-sn-glycerol-3-phosphate acyltransferase